RDEALVRKAETPVHPFDLGGHVPRGQVVVLGEDGERLYHRVRRRNSLRSDSSSSYRPRQTVVTVTEPSSSTPRIAVHMCEASSLTATPRAPVSSFSPPAISSPATYPTWACPWNGSAWCSQSAWKPIGPSMICACAPSTSCGRSLGK